ncbi:hypothetical protein K458DRAFT_389521 [Lentithecium fluviatile CBS 122367]|uniref:Uncharacterized protein n=1 Tax=Lentithecium fluviatile CBS 122367 TaxID=1168545 RepID=A0A6G1IZC7_9PLEO|nr:hypothetical protein K458DRAFT_389521 [Lentithecium fluviatile CBS 122367]
MAQTNSTANMIDDRFRSCADHAAPPFLQGDQIEVEEILRTRRRACRRADARWIRSSSSPLEPPHRVDCCVDYCADPHAHHRQPEGVFEAIGTLLSARRSPPTAMVPGFVFSPNQATTISSTQSIDSRTSNAAVVTPIRRLDPGKRNVGVVAALTICEAVRKGAMAWKKDEAEWTLLGTSNRRHLDVT